MCYPAILTPCLEKDGFTVEVPDLQGCVTEGSTLENAIEMGIDAASGWVLDELEQGKDIPKSSNLSDIIVKDGSFKQLLMLDLNV